MTEKTITTEYGCIWINGNQATFHFTEHPELDTKEEDWKTEQELLNSYFDMVDIIYRGKEKS